MVFSAPGRDAVVGSAMTSVLPSWRSWSRCTKMETFDWVLGTPRLRLLWHPKILFGFIKFFIWFEGGYLKFSSKGLSFSKNFFYDKYFPWVHPKLDLWSWGFFILCWLNTNVFHWESFWKSFLLKITLWLMEWSFPFQKLSLAMT